MGVSQRPSKLATTASALVAPMIVSTQLSAMQFTFDGGNGTGSFDTTLTIGASMRTEQRDERLGVSGNRNFDRWDIFTSAPKALHELSIDYGSWTFVSRASYFYDVALHDEDLPGGAKRAQDHADILDAFIQKEFNFSNNSAARVRLGRQVVSWGESTFIGNGINGINTTDVGKLRLAGSELKEALLPTNMAYLQWATGTGLSFETFYLLDWKKVKLDPMGTFFSTNDTFADGGTAFPVGGGHVLTRYSADAPDTGGQWGVAAHYFFSPLNTEFGIYHWDLASQSFVLSYRSLGIGVDGQYYLEYPEHLRLTGLSFNTRIGELAVFGEVSHRSGVPALRSNFITAGLTNTLPFGQRVSGLGEISTTQAQVTVQKTINPIYQIGARGGSFLFEAGATQTHDIKKYGDLLSVPDKFAWGYVASASLNYPQAIGSINLTPTFALNHNVNGTGGPFLDERKQLSLGVNWDMRQRWQGGITHTWIYGGGLANTLKDRDFLSISFTYSF